MYEKKYFSKERQLTLALALKRIENTCIGKYQGYMISNSKDSGKPYF